MLRRPHQITNYQRVKSDNALFTKGSCPIVETNQKWKAALRTPTQKAAAATTGQGRSSQLAEVKAVQLALNIAE